MPCWIQTLDRDNWEKQESTKETDKQIYLDIFQALTLGPGLAYI